jgi:hypothetical protein
VTCFVGVLWCFMTMLAHTLPPQRKISLRHLVRYNWIIPLQPRLSVKWFLYVHIFENFPWWPAVPVNSGSVQQIMPYFSSFRLWSLVVILLREI